MANIVSTTYINEGPDVVFKAISNMDTFVKHISGVRKLATKYSDSNKRISQWEIDVDGTLVRWTEEQFINASTRTIYFTILDGDFATYEGQWIVKPVNNGSQLELRFNIEWELQIDHPSITSSLDRKANLAARWALREIRKKIGLGKTVSTSDLSNADQIISEPIQLKNSRNMNIVGFYDRIRDNPTTNPFVIVVPGYGETKRDALMISYYLARNGYNVIRYDATDHVGESEGNIYRTTLNNSKMDLISVIDNITKIYQISSVGVIASSLSQRVAIKAASEDARIAVVIGLVGIVDLQKTLKEIYREDIIGDIQHGKIKPAYEVLGYVIDKQFPIEAIALNYHNLQSTLSDAESIKVPVVLLCAERDAWIELTDVKKVISKCPNSLSRLEVIPDAMHQLMENPRVLRIALKQIVVVADRILKCEANTIDDIVEPTKKELALQNKIEKERLKLMSKPFGSNERVFWESYMDKFIMLIKVPDYGQYFSRIDDILGVNGTKMKILDVGCGNGYLGTSLLLRQMLSGDNTSVKIGGFEYYGIDQSDRILDMAREGHEGILRNRLRDRFEKQDDIPSFHYETVDLNGMALPYQANYFDRICASLLLSYLDNPIKAIEEFIRVLKPGGLIVLTSLKPSADMSEIYRNFLNVCKNESDVVLARELLNEAGQIKDKVNRGFYHFYSDKELKTLLVASGIKKVICEKSFGNQANIAFGQKA